MLRVSDKATRVNDGAGFAIMLKVTASGQRQQRNARFLAIQNEIFPVLCALLARFANCFEV